MRKEMKKKEKMQKKGQVEKKRGREKIGVSFWLLYTEFVIERE